MRLRLLRLLLLLLLRVSCSYLGVARELEWRRWLGQSAVGWYVCWLVVAGGGPVTWVCLFSWRIALGKDAEPEQA